jgi:3-oxoadipate enol-lactonase
MPFTKAKDGVELHYALHDYTDPWKNAPVLLLQHGFGRSEKFWYSLIPYLSRFYHVVCPDLRGLGQSSQNFDFETGISIANYLSDIGVIADAVGASSFHYAGESFGGMLGTAFAAEYPRRVRTLTLISSSIAIREDAKLAYAHGHASWTEGLLAMGSRGYAEQQNAGTRFPPDTDPELLKWNTDRRAEANVDVLIAMSKLAPIVNNTAVLAKISVPVLGIYPTNGAFTKSGQRDVLTSKIANLRIVDLPTEYHMGWMLMPAKVADSILHFVALHDGIVCRE